MRTSPDPSNKRGSGRNKTGYWSRLKPSRDPQSTAAPVEMMMNALSTLNYFFAYWQFSRTTCLHRCEQWLWSVPYESPTRLSICTGNLRLCLPFHPYPEPWYPRWDHMSLYRIICVPRFNDKPMGLSGPVLSGFNKFPPKPGARYTSAFVQLLSLQCAIAWTGYRMSKAALKGGVEATANCCYILHSGMVSCSKTGLLQTARCFLIWF